MIGVTPFASILQSLVERVRRGEEVGQLRRLDFIWVNREYRSLEWFLLLLRDLESAVFTNFLTVQLFVSSGPSTQNDDTISLALALDLLYQKSRRDALTGLMMMMIMTMSMMMMMLTMFLTMMMMMLTMFMTMTMLTMMILTMMMLTVMMMMMKGLRTRCSPGRPKWSEVLTEISEKSAHQVRSEKYIALPHYFPISGDALLLRGSTGGGRHPASL